MKVIFFGSSKSVFSNRHFQALLGAPCTVAGVVDAPAGGPVSTNLSTSQMDMVAEAQRVNIPVYVGLKPNAPELVQALAALEPDLFVAAGYTGILKAPVLAVPRLLTANFHASLLPAYRGLHPLYWALRNGEKEVGITVHVVDETIDTGDILYQVRVAVHDADTVSTLYDRVMAESLILVPRLISDATAGTLVSKSQATEGASYYGHIPPEHTQRQA